MDRSTYHIYVDRSEETQHSAERSQIACRLAARQSFNVRYVTMLEHWPTKWPTSFSYLLCLQIGWFK